ncbi:putative reverse transcriptase domain-containing protein [Tanacetum coccineum]
MVRIGAVPKPPSDDEDTERPRKKSKNSTSDGTEGPSEPRGPPIELVFWSCIALDGDMIMPQQAMYEARMREVIREQVSASMAEFMANMNRGAGGDEAGGAGASGAGAGGAGAGGAGSGGAGAGGAGAGGARSGGAGASGARAGGAGVGGSRPAAPEITRCTYERDKVKFATATLQGRALTWWNGRITSMGIDAANGTSWTEVRKWMTEEFCHRSVLQRLEQELYNLKLKGTDIDGYTNRFHELALLCPRMVEPEQVKVEQYISGLSKNIRGDVTSSRPVGIDEAVRMAYQLMGQIIQDKTDEVSKGEKRKGEGDRGGRCDNRRDYNRRQNQIRANVGAMTNVAPNDNERDTAERRLHKSRVWNKGFYLDMVRIGAVPKPPSDDEDTERPRKKSKNSTSDGTEGPFDPRGPPVLDGDIIMPPKAMSEARMREVIREQVAASMAEFVANMNHGAGGAEADGAGVGGAEAGGTGTGGAGAGSAGAGGAGAGGAGPAAPKITGCTYITFMKCDPHPFKGTEGAVGLCQWFEKLESMFRISNCKEKDKVKFATATLQGRALTWWNGRIASMGIDAANGTPWTEVKVEQYIRGLLKNIRGDVTSSKPAGIDEAVRMAYQLMGQIIQDKTDEISEGENRKGEGDRGMDKSKITRKQSKASKHGHENQKSTKPKPKIQSLS